MRALALHSGWIGIVLMILPLPLCFSLTAWVFETRFCRLYWSPACSQLAAARMTVILAIMTLGANVFIMHRMAVHEAAEWVLYLMLVYTGLFVLMMARIATRFACEFYRRPRVRQLELPLGLPE